MSRHPHQPEPNASLPGSEPTTAQADFEERVLALLSGAPEVTIPPGFAASVARRACAQPATRPAVWMGWGPCMAVVSGVLMTAGLFAVAPHAAPSWHNGWFDAQIVLLAELSGLLLFAQRLLASD